MGKGQENDTHRRACKNRTRVLSCGSSLRVASNPDLQDARLMALTPWSSRFNQKRAFLASNNSKGR